VQHIPPTTRTCRATHAWFRPEWCRKCRGIQYPTSLGKINAQYGQLTQGALLTWDNLYGYSVGITFIDPYAYSCWNVGDPPVTFQEWLAKNSPTGSSTEAVTIDGLTGVSEAPGLVYLEDNKDGYPHFIIYELHLECSFGPVCTPPGFWQTMLASFETLRP
jgi:hypothetical protein